MHYLSYLSALDTQDTEVQKKLGELEYLGIQLSELTLFVSQEWKELGADKIRAFASSPLLAAYRNDLIESANNVQYILDEKVEQALNKICALGIFGLHEEPEVHLISLDRRRWYRENSRKKIRAFAKNPNRDIRPVQNR
jgi:oligoendopeptidase F